jgi:hypothetical protein
VASESCDLCQGRLYTPGHRSCGLELCDDCLLGGNVGERVSHRGFRITQRIWTETSKNDSSSRTHHTEVTGFVATTLRVHLRFNHESFVERIGKWLGTKELQVGDDLFDDAVFVVTQTPALAKQVLAIEGQQMVVLEALSELGTIKFDPADDGCQVTIHSAISSKASVHPSTGQQRAVACALHHLLRAESGN